MYSSLLIAIKINIKDSEVQYNYLITNNGIHFEIKYQV